MPLGRQPSEHPLPSRAPSPKVQQPRPSHTRSPRGVLSDGHSYNHARSQAHAERQAVTGTRTLGHEDSCWASRSGLHPPLWSLLPSPTHAPSPHAPDNGTATSQQTGLIQGAGGHRTTKAGAPHSGPVVSSCTDLGGGCAPGQGHTSVCSGPCYLSLLTGPDHSP